MLLKQLRPKANYWLVHIADILSPTFGATCPTSLLVVYAERGLFSAQVNWNEPVATDNSGVPPAVTSNYKPLQRLSQGTHVIVYTAVDQSRNNATCSFTVAVTGTKRHIQVSFFFCFIVL